MSSRISPALRNRTRRRGGAGWSTLVVCCTVVALVWPSLGPLPWLAMAGSQHHDIARAAAPDVDPAGHDYDASDFPGSPMHPADHDCLQCQVLKHLARCVLSQPAVAEVAPPEGCPPRPDFVADSQHERRAGLLPPVRAPPTRIA